MAKVSVTGAQNAFDRFGPIRRDEAPDISPWRCNLVCVTIFRLCCSLRSSCRDGNIFMFLDIDEP